MPRISRQHDGTRVCASCGTPRGNTRTAWVPITEHGAVTGFTCPDCPTVHEPIRRTTTKAGAVRYRAVVYSAPVGHPERRQAVKVARSVDEARAFVATVRAAVERDGFYDSAGARAERAAQAETLGALAARWLASRTDVRDVTREGYRTVLAPVLRRLGERPVAALTVSDVEALTAWLTAEGGSRGQSLSPRSVRASLVALGQVLDVAVREGRVPQNVARLARRPRQRKVRGTDLEHWTPDQVRRFRAHADTDPWAGAWRLTLAGITRSEVAGLRWSDVDLDAGTVTIARGRVVVDGGAVTATDDPKSDARRRTVPVESIHTGTAAMLRTWRTAQRREAMERGEPWSEDRLVLVNVVGEPVRPEYYSDRFRALCAAAGVPVIRLHSVRHSLAFWLHSLGVTPADAAALLGHTVQVHLATYLPASGSSGIATAAAALGGASKAAV